MILPEEFAAQAEKSQDWRRKRIGKSICALQSEATGRQCAGLRRYHPPHGGSAADGQGDAGLLPAQVPLRPHRRVSGHQPFAVSTGQSAGRGTPQHLRGRRRRSEHLPLPGANIENILNFEKQYTGARTIRLEQNYRSTQNILDGANAVIRHNTGRKGKTLWTENGKGEIITSQDLLQ